MNGLKNSVFEINRDTLQHRKIAVFREPFDAVLFVNAMRDKGANVYAIDYAGDRYPAVKPIRFAKGA